MKLTQLETMSKTTAGPARLALGELKSSATLWLERLAEMLAGGDMQAGFVKDESYESVVEMRLEVPLQSQNVVAVMAIDLKVTPNLTRDLTEFRLTFHVERMVGTSAWIDVSVPTELRQLAVTLKGSKSVNLVASQLIEQLDSVDHLGYLIFFESLMH